jgi:hypothetical protein
MTTRPPSRVLNRLAAYFDRNGYVRRRMIESQSSGGGRSARCADELRLTAQSDQELQLIRRLLQQAGFKPGRAFAKKRQFRIPVYGRRAVERFLALVDRQENAEPAGCTERRDRASLGNRTPLARRR